MGRVGGSVAGKPALIGAVGTTQHKVPFGDFAKSESLDDHSSSYMSVVWFARQIVRRRKAGVDTMTIKALGQVGKSGEGTRAQLLPNSYRSYTGI